MSARKWICVVLMGVVCRVGFGDVAMRTTIPDVLINGAFEEAGSLTMVVDDDDFSSASAATPVYIRVRLEAGAYLRETRVEIQGMGHAPIHLAARLDTLFSDFRIALDPQALSVVRWRAGENAIWLRVSQSSTSWIEHIPSAKTQAPSAQVRVLFTIGIDGLLSWSVNQALFGMGMSNMRANSTLPNPISLVDAETTVQVVDLTQSTDLPFPHASALVRTDVLAFLNSTGVTSESDPDEITLGPQIAVLFTGDDAIARGQSLFFFFNIWPDPVAIDDLVRHLGP